MTTQQDPFSAGAAEAAQFLGGGRTIAAKFPKNGFKVEGTVLSLSVEQRTDRDTGDLLWWESRRPTPQGELKSPATTMANERNKVKQLLIDLQGEPTGVTWETLKYIEKEVPEDDGIRRLYVSSPEMQKAIAKAVGEHSLRAPEVGGYLEVVKTGEERIAGTDMFKFLYAARYTPASKNEKAAGDLLNPFGESEETPADPFAKA